MRKRIKAKLHNDFFIKQERGLSARVFLISLLLSSTHLEINYTIYAILHLT